MLKLMCSWKMIIQHGSDKQIMFASMLPTIETKEDPKTVERKLIQTFIISNADLCRPYACHGLYMGSTLSDFDQSDSSPQLEDAYIEQKHAIEFSIQSAKDRISSSTNLSKKLQPRWKILKAIRSLSHGTGKHDYQFLPKSIMRSFCLSPARNGVNLLARARKCFKITE